MVLPQKTLQHFRVDGRHLLRVWVYCVVVPLPILTTIVFAGWRSSMAYRGHPNAAGGRWPVLIAWIFVSLFLVHSLRCGLRDYLRLPYALGLAAASQVLASLTYAWWTVFLSLIL